MSSVSTKSGTTAKFGAGKTATIHTKSGATITRSASGSRTVSSTRKDGSRVVSNGHGRGYVEHNGFRGGHAYRSRTYYNHGHYYARGYRGYYWHGHGYWGGYPGYWYGGGYYGWAYNPWVAPVAYGWGWGGAPWFGFYGAYFAPYPVYPSAAFWLTDYLIAANLQAAYAAQAAAAGAAAGAAAAAVPSEYGGAAAADGGDAAQAPAAGGTVALTPEVKQAIADEVKAQIAAEQAQAATANTSSGGAAAAAPAAATQSAQAGAAPANEELPAALDPQHTIFVVADDINETTPDGEECSLTSGDVLNRIDDTPDKDNKVTVRVTSSKKADCAAGAKVAVSVDDLQEMHNHFQEQVDDGLKKLADNQGKNGLPSSPNPQARANPDANPEPDKTAQADLDALDKSADQTEAEVQQAARDGAGDD